MFKTIALVVVLLIAGVLIYAATKPDTFRIERSTRIKAAPEEVHADNKENPVGEPSAHQGGAPGPKAKRSAHLEQTEVGEGDAQRHGDRFDLPSFFVERKGDPQQ